MTNDQIEQEFRSLRQALSALAELQAASVQLLAGASDLSDEQRQSVRVALELVRTAAQKLRDSP